MFEPFVFNNGIEPRNRVAMALMTTWGVNADGNVSGVEVAYYKRRVNGVGLVMTGCTDVLENGIAFTDEFSAFDNKFILSLQRLA